MRAALVAVSASRNGGGITFALQSLARALQVREQIEVRVLALSDAHSEADRLGWGNIDLRIADSIGPAAIGYSPRLASELSLYDAQIAHTHGIWMWPSAAVAKWSRNGVRRHVVSPHGMLDPWALANSRWKKKIAFSLYERAHLRQAACISALNVSEAQSIRQFGLKNPICIIPNGVDIDDSHYDAEPPWTAEQSAGRKTLLFLGRIHPKKGLTDLINAWSQLTRGNHPQIHEWSLVIAGWDQLDHEREVKTQVEELGLQSDVRFVGPVHGASKIAALRAARGFVLPSKSEGLPVAVLEAWAQGLPVAMTPQCNIPEGFVENAAINLGTSVDQIAIGLANLFEMSDSQRQNMGALGKRLASTQFTWTKIASQTHSVYQWALGGGPPPDCVRLGAIN